MKARRSNGDGAIDKIQRKRKDGTVVERWRGRVSLVDLAGRKIRKSVYAATRSELATKIARLQADASRGIVPSGERLNVATYMRRWLDQAARPTVRPATLRQYDGMVRLHIIPHIGKIQLDKLSPKDVQGLLVSLEREGKSARMRQLVYAVLHRALGQALKWDLVFRNVAQNAARPRVARRELRTLNVDQARRLLAVAAEGTWHALFALAITTGMRQGELLALRWPDVDLGAGIVQVRHTLTQVNRKAHCPCGSSKKYGECCFGDSKSGTLLLAEPKTAKSRRVIELPSSAVASLREHRRQLLARGLRASEWVFPDRTGGPMDAHNLVRRVFKPLLRKIQRKLDDEAAKTGHDFEKFPEIRFHDLRHTAATLMLSAGVHPKVVQERLGHATIAMTLDVYSHVVPSMQRDAADRMEVVLSAPKAGSA
jgi:integrase